MVLLFVSVSINCVGTAAVWIGFRKRNEKKKPNVERLTATDRVSGLFGTTS